MPALHHRPRGAAPLSSPRWKTRGRRRTPPRRGSPPWHPRTAPAARGSRPACPDRAPPRTAPGRRPRPPPPSVLRPLAQGGEVELLQGLLEQAPLVLLGERLARHLLGGHDGQVRHLAADLLDRPLRLDFNLPPSALHQPLAPPLGPGLGLPLVSRPGLAPP